MSRAPARNRRAALGAAPVLAAALVLPGLPAAPAAADPLRGAPPAVVDLGVEEIAELLAAGETTSVELTRQYLRRIAAYEQAYGDQPGVNAVIATSPYALADAARADAERVAGRVRGPLHGVPLVLKDNYDTGDLPTTNGSEALAGMQPPDDGTQVERLRAAGSVVVAKTNLHEYARGITTISSLGGQTRNPFDQTRNPGGSSGGTAAAVAAAFAPIGMGSDTCGSIRYPAAHNGLVGLRATQGLFSADGVIPLSVTQDVAGPLGRSVADVATVLDATKGYDAKDPQTRVAVGTTPASFRAGLSDTALQGARVGLLTDYLGDANARQLEVTGLVRAATADLTEQGATVVEVGPQPALLTALGGAGVINDEFKRDIEDYLSRPGLGLPAGLAARTAPTDRATLSDIVADGGVTPSVLSSLVTSVSSPALPNAAYLGKLQQRELARTLLAALMDAQDLDALVYPALQEEAVPVGQSQPGGNCALSAQTGFPALTVPAGQTSSGLPVGLELLGRPFSDPALLALGHDYEQATQHRTAAPSTPELEAVTCDPAGASPFADAQQPPHAAAITCLADLGVVQGVAPDRFAPADPVTRGQLASLLVRALDTAGVPVPTGSPDAFGDDDGSEHEDAIDALAALGVLQGLAPGVAAPDARVTRGQAASLVARTLTQVLSVQPQAREDLFADDDGSTHEAAANGLASFGALLGTAPGRFDPQGTLTRGQSASLVLRAVL